MRDGHEAGGGGVYQSGPGGGGGCPDRLHRNPPTNDRSEGGWGYAISDLKMIATSDARRYSGTGGVLWVSVQCLVP